MDTIRRFNPAFPYSVGTVCVCASIAMPAKEKRSQAVHSWGGVGGDRRKGHVCFIEAILNITTKHIQAALAAHLSHAVVGQHQALFPKSRT